MKTKGIFQFEIIINDLVRYLCYGSTAILGILFFSVRDRLFTSESDVCRRQILTYKDSPRDERVNADPPSAGVRVSIKPALGQHLLFVRERRKPLVYNHKLATFLTSWLNILLIDILSSFILKFPCVNVTYKIDFKPMYRWLILIILHFNL